MNSSRLLLLPYKLLVSFMILTQFLYFWGPLQFDKSFNFLLFLFFIIVDLVFIIGYKQGIKKKTENRELKYTNKVSNLVFIGMLMIIPQFVSGWHLSSFSLHEFYNRFIAGLFNPGQVFNERNEAMGTSLITYLLMLLSPLTISAKVLSIYFWKSFSKSMKITIIVYYVLTIVYWLGIGTRKGLFDVAIILIFTLLMSDFSIVNSRKKRRRILVLGLVSVSLFLFYFVYSNLSRFGLESGELLEFDQYSIKNSYKTVLPPALNIVLAQITSYLCQGYHALSLSLSDWFNYSISCFSYGLGSNWFKISVVERLLPNVDVLSMTYQGYLWEHYRIDPEASWHSLYLWLANDVTFFGVPFIIYLFSYYCGFFWKSAINKTRIVDAPLSILFIMFFAYSFANNQVFSFSFIAFWGLIIIRLISKISQFNNISR